MKSLSILMLAKYRTNKIYCGSVFSTDKEKTILSKIVSVQFHSVVFIYGQIATAIASRHFIL